MRNPGFLDEVLSRSRSAQSPSAQFERKTKMNNYNESQARRYCTIGILLCLLLVGAAAQGQVTSLSLNSDPGDFVGGGQTAFFTPADGTFGASGISTGNHVSVSFLGQPGIFWFLDFAAPSGQPLTVGTYTGAARWPFEAANQPGLS